MQNPSRSVDSSQAGPHERLPEIVRRHRDRRWRQPIAAHTRVAFEAVQAVIDAQSLPLVLDSGCGTGESTAGLAEHWPNHWVIGIDQSAHRLRRSGWSSGIHVEGRCILVRAEAADFWRLALAAGWRLAGHFLLYPNPWPKPTQLKRRWHGHPVFPTLMALGGALELRSNWRIYLEEFALAAEILVGTTGTIQALRVDAAISPFEKKYAASGHALFQLRLQLRG